MNGYSTNRGCQRAFSLIELMVAMTLGLMVVAAVATLSLNATRSYRALNLVGEQIENGRYALKLLKDDIEHAGFFGPFLPLAGNLPAQGLANPCENTSLASHLASLEQSFLLPVTGYVASATSSNNPCGISAKAGTSILVVRRAAVVIRPGLDRGRAYLQTLPDQYLLGVVLDSTSAFLPSGHTDFDLRGINGLAEIRQYHIHIYYLKDQSLYLRVPIYKDDGGGQPIIDGIENMQVQYGVDTSSPPDGTPDKYLPTPNNPNLPMATDWQNVVTVKLNLLVRALEKDINYTDNKSYDLGTLLLEPIRDHYHRRVFSQVVRLINVSGRRE